jgi:nucleoid-associated protein YgaU
VAKAMLIGKLPIPGQVTFDFNPEKIKVAKGTAKRRQNSVKAGGNSPAALKGAEPESLDLGQVVLDGSGTKDTCELLLSWMKPGGGLLGSIIGGAISMVSSALGGPAINLATKLPQLTFVYGTGFIFECELNRCTVNYTLFDDMGVPTRAEVNMTLQRRASLLDLAELLPTNPSSGGAPGRRSHIVTAGENLQTIATANYGAPKHWRTVAASNGVDDPLRVHPGRHIYLPNISELTEAR